MELVNVLLSTPALRAAAILLASLLVATIIQLPVHRLLVRLAEKTATEVDDRLVKGLRRPVFVSILLAGIYLAAVQLELDFSDAMRRVVTGVVISAAVVLWAMSLIRVGTLLLTEMSERPMLGAWVQPSSLPLFHIVLKGTVVLGAAYFVFLAWDMDLTAWIASAGVLGVALGFGAKDSLANLFAGIFILVDGPYKVGDFVVLDDGLRGRVTWIGVRSTRILTLDHVEITIPNGIIANGRIINESGGPNPMQRLAIDVAVAYGSDIDRVDEVLRRCVAGFEHVLSDPKPAVRFVEFGDSGLNFQLLAWISEPSVREGVLSDLNRRVYKELGAANIEIPYSKHDLYVKEFPASRAVTASAAAQLS